MLSEDRLLKNIREQVMNYCCIYDRKECRPMKIARASSSKTGWVVKLSLWEKWLEGEPPASYVRYVPDRYKRTDCNECRHKLACLVDQYCDRRFKSK